MKDLYISRRVHARAGLALGLVMLFALALVVIDPAVTSAWVLAVATAIASVINAEIAIAGSAAADEEAS